ncbi:zinc finger CCCH domain-containing protein 38 [Morus notabilis]|uniref:zinc finger CCCH domain-containing protein 38 n=1 Tax=Morus notabilis TaxID=981085 RepID=UPI000CED2F4A|nr:zinc finger CCCH domain-containing protein 38 [Morus notabilis]XP_024017748.1 zinc finger CCCH domain-containing protein 38 [Morus notabilis]XP_024017749.1 zinc finger CCCH domain-containing protein 38 [Morus notabilis]XP_024017750.1 zinc finger CCCH domain-containing protein 38 [Morus notabilis]
MSGSGRKRSSKWDQAQFDDENAQDDSWHGKSGRSFYPRESGHGWQSPELVGNNGSKWSALETNDLRSKRDSVLPSRESRGSHKNENIDKDDKRYVEESMAYKDDKRYVEESMAWDANEDYGTRMSPGLDEWRHQHPSQSPKSGWSRSLRDRSRSRSRSKSRGRSRSPVRSLRRESGFPDRSRSRSGVSSQLCKDFIAGRCRRGNHCMFLHEGNEDYDDYWDSRHRKGTSSKYSNLDTRDYPLRSGRPSVPCNDFVKGRCRRGASCRFEHHGVSDGFSKGYSNEVSRDKENDRMKRDNSAERGVEHEFRRTSDIPCKFFAAGNCRNGRHCRFSHHSQPYESPDRKSQDRWASGRKPDDVNRVFDGHGSKWNDTVIVPDAAKLNEDINRNICTRDSSSTGWSMNDRLRSSVNNESTTNADPTSSCAAAKNNEKEALQWKPDNAGVSTGLHESRHAEKWLGGMDMSPDWNYTVSSANRTVKEEQSRIPPYSESFNDMSLTTSKQNVNREATGQINVAASVVPPMIVDKSFFPPKHDLRDDTATALQYDDNSAVIKAVSSRADLNISANITPTQSFDQNVQCASVFPFSSLNTTGQSQVVIPTVPQGGILKNPQNSAPSIEANSTTKPEFLDAKTSLVNSRIAPTQNIGSGEQLTNLTNLSASLVQLLGNGQQLPQLYAALNSNNSTGAPSFANTEALVFPVSTSSVQPDPAIVPHKHYDPRQASTESKRPEISNSPSGVLPNTTMKTSVSYGRSEMQLQNLNPQPLSGALGLDSKQPGDLVEEPKQEMQGLTTLEPNVSSDFSKGKNELGSGDNKKALEENRKVEDGDPVDGVDKEGANDGKKSKDSKGSRAFKFALVEFVKELLKPTWKEGQIDKDAYKNIVKKVVDKVTSTMQGANIPQTQEKIDHYLSFSKPKLTKLVQAYVEKNQKG